MAKEKQHDLKKDKVFNPDETHSLEDGWKEICNLPNGWLAKKQYDIKKDKVSNPDDTISLEDGWEASCNLPSCWMAKEIGQPLHQD